MSGEGSFTISGIDRVEYMALDATRAIAFYRDVLGMVPTEIDEQGRGAEFTLADGTTFGLWSDPGAPFQPSQGVLFAVDDLDAAVTALEARGVVILRRMETPFCTMAFIHDTEGNEITLHQRKAAASGAA